jgi:hypothetical protein
VFSGTILGSKANRLGLSGSHSTGGGVLTNFTRVETFGARNSHLTNPHDGDAYPAYHDKLRALREAFDGQVALIHGDSHYFKMDKPLNHARHHPMWIEERHRDRPVAPPAVGPVVVARREDEGPLQRVEVSQR